MIPRWRSLRSTPSEELRSQRVRPSSVRLKDFQSRIEAKFEKSRALSDAADALEASIVFGKSEATVRVAKAILFSQSATNELKHLAQAVVSPLPKDTGPNKIDLRDELYRKIARAKNTLAEHPRDGLLSLEIARLQMHLGQVRSAKKYAERAIDTYPNNRYVLRSISCMFAAIYEEERALHYIKRSDIVRDDPWVQAAEVSLCGILKKSPKWGARRINSIKAAKHLGIDSTELAAGLAAVEFRTGNQKSAKKLLEQSMQSPNENSLAQLRWLQEKGNFAQQIYPDRQVPNAYEANAYYSLAMDNALEAVRCSELWLQDQPFQSHAATFGSSLCISVLSDYERAINMIDLALISMPDDPFLNNNRLVALCLLGRVKEAEPILQSKIGALRENTKSLPFYHAAHGMYAFAVGHFEDGRYCYREAFKAAAATEDYGQLLLAMIYWLEREISSQQFSVSDLNPIIEKIDSLLDKNWSLKRNTRLVWGAFKKRVAAKKQEGLYMKNEQISEFANFGLNSFVKN